jgi:hypothetical protein
VRGSSTIKEGVTKGFYSHTKSLLFCEESHVSDLESNVLLGLLALC